ncbi:MAG: hypothetical protein M1816_005031 [Peltula sp. TS41687]|nr:MAG: hypothetical protein M1816_005031 [Peltula sp. TS41687]
MPLFLHDKLQVFLVKGNYMTLAVKPKAVDIGEWIAHQVVEQYRTLTKFIEVIQGADPGKLPMCNQLTCPTMSAGSHTYTWLDNARQPTRLPAFRYIELVEKWITSKIMDNTLFPIESTSTPATSTTYASGGLNTPGATTPIAMGPTSLNAPLSALSGRDWIGKSCGFPEHFFQDCRNIYKQMLRVYAHIYWNHFEVPFYHLDMEAWLNSCFIHFIIVGTELELLTNRDLEPMQALLEKWISLDKFPTDCKFLAMVAAANVNSRQGGSSGGGSGGSAAAGTGGTSGAAAASPTASNQSTTTLAMSPSALTPTTSTASPSVLTPTSSSTNLSFPFP